MPQTEVLLFSERDGSCPLIEWMDSLSSKVRDKCIVRIERLAEMGHELRRPEADYLRDGIYELRAGFQGIHYRVLYFFSGKQAVISHGVVKEGKVPRREIELAIQRREQYRDDPSAHTYIR